VTADPITTDHLAMIADTRLSEAARILGLAIMLADADEDGYSELSRDDLRTVLSTAQSDDSIRRFLRELENAKWVESKAGGRGHANRYRIIGPHEYGPIGSLRSALVHTLSDSFGSGADLSVTYGRTRAHPKRPVGGTVGGEEVGRSKEEVPPSVSPPAELSDKAAELLEGGDLEGCRGALSDYLRLRVPPDRQYPYIQTVRTWIQGGADASVFRRPTGGSVPLDQRTGVVAEAVNELAAGIESKMKRPVGDPGNLKTKIDIIIRQRDDHERRSKRTNGRGAPGGPGAPGPEAGGRPKRPLIPVEGLDDDA